MRGGHVRLLVVLLVGALAAGCSAVERTVIGGYLAVNRMTARELVMSDGYKGRYYEHTYGDPGAVDTLIFFVQGSGGETAQLVCRFLLNGVSGDVRVFALEKRHVSSWSTGKGHPSRRYLESYSPSALLADEKELLAHVLAKKETGGKNVVVLGVSAGGMTAMELARAVPQVTHLAVLGEGGMKGLDSFRLWARQHDQDFVDALWEDVRADPSPTREVAGYSARCWYELLAADPMGVLEGLDIPIFAVMGEKDEEVPVESLRYLERAFRDLGKANLTTKVYTGCDHALDECGDHPGRGAYGRDLMAWVRAHPPVGRARPVG